MPKMVDIPFPFPLKGYDANWAYATQPRLTTPSSSNVRVYSADAERARGGSRPGLKQAYSQQAGGTATPVQWAGWLDYGFGDTVFYEDTFEYADGQLNTRTGTKWTSANGCSNNLTVLNGYVRLPTGTLPVAESASGNHGEIVSSSDTWSDFTLEAGVGWNVGATFVLKLWAASNVNGTDGALLTLTYTSADATWPELGVRATMTMKLTSGSTSRQTTINYGPYFHVTGGAVRIEADQTTVRFFWDGVQLLTVARDDGTCDKAGFSMSLDNDTTILTDAAMDIRLLDWRLTAITRATATSRKLVAVSNRSVWAESSEGTLAAVTGGTTAMAAQAVYSAAHHNGRLFLVDGTQPKVYDPVAGTVADFAARKGVIIKTVRGAVNWRNRLVLFNSVEDPTNYYMSRQDDAYDFDYGQDDAQSAVAGNVSDAGRIGDPIRAICPLADDVAVFGCTRSLWTMHGDPAAGGRAWKISDETGIVHANAWTTDANGLLYFIGEEGFYVMSPRGIPKNLSFGRIPTLSGFRPVVGAGVSGESYVTLAYDHDRHGVLIFVTPFATAAASHHFYDIRTDSFWPETYPNACGPACSAWYNATTPTYRKLLLGGRNGYLYEFADATKSDIVTTGGTVAISSNVWLGPHRLSGTEPADALLVSLLGTLGSGSDIVGYEVYADDTIESVLAMASGTTASTGSWSANRNLIDRTRIRGGAVGIRLLNSTAGRRWSLESVWGQAVSGGVHR